MESEISVPLGSGPDDGLFRTRLAGRHARTREAFEALRRSTPVLNAGRRGDAGPYWQRLAVSEDPGEGAWELFGLRDDIYLVISDCCYGRARSECVLPEDFVEFHFMLRGPVSVELSERGQVSITAPNLTVVHQGADVNYRVSCGPGTWRSVGIYVSAERFRRFIDASLGVGSRLAAELRAVRNDQILCQQMPVGLQALSAVEALLANPYSGYRRLLFAEAKATEILCASVDLWQSYLESRCASDMFSARDLRLIEKAKDIMLGDLSRVLTIAELARAVGTNTSKLKRGFKFLYGMTVFELGHRHRLNEALRLLIEERLSVNEVASAVGYQHQTSFTASFRDHFGFAPKDGRRMVNVNDLRTRAAKGESLRQTSPAPLAD